ICNIFTLHKYFSKNFEIDRVNKECRTAEIGCVDCKRILWNNMVEELKPIREKSLELINNPASVIDTLNTGAEKCRKIAGETMEEVRSLMGLR
ncbi:MAG: tryptophan--tRNA ligase, partial [Candidatus Scalindua sp.]